MDLDFSFLAMSIYHIHIEKGDGYARIEIESLKITNSYNFNKKELGKLIKIIKSNQREFKGVWNEYFKE